MRLLSADEVLEVVSRRRGELRDEEVPHVLFLPGNRSYGEWPESHLCWTGSQPIF